MNELDSRDVGDAIMIGRLAKDSQEVSPIISIIKMHRKLTNNPEF